MNKLYGLIPAAGKGTRAYPYTKKTPKSMLEINGYPNLFRNILLMRDSLKISDIFIVIGHQGHIIKDYFKDGRQLNVNLTYIENHWVEKGMAYSIMLGKEYIKDHFVVILSDECYVGSDHSKILYYSYQDALATISIIESDNKDDIKRNYSVKVQDGRVVKLVEKPKEVHNNILGCGTFIFHPRIFHHIEQSFENSKGKHVDLITLLDNLCGKGEVIKYFELKGKYANINDRDSLQLAKYYVREQIWYKCVITLLIYSEGNEEDITFTINQYKKLHYLNHLYVLLPNDSQIDDEVEKCGVKIIKCPEGINQYGEKIKYGFNQLPGDILILTEANYSFPYRDVSKLLAYLKEADMVIGTRTTRQLIQQRSYMRGIVRLANIFLAKLLELLLWRFDCRFTDVGCTLRALWKSTFDKIKDNLVTAGPQFSVEMTMEILRARDRIIEVPVNYYGKSYSLYRKHQNIYTFFKMLYHICYRSFMQYFRS